MLRTMTRLTLGLGLIAGATAAQAVIPIYPHRGTENSAQYSFTAAATGNIVAYFAGSGASFNETLGLLVNGVETGITGLQNHTTAVGSALTLGQVAAGDILTFFIDVATTRSTYYSDGARNADGANHVWSTGYAGGDFGLPAGRYVAFEDLARGRSDNNYGDERFVFTNVAATSSAPEPAAWAMLAGGLALAGMTLRRRKALYS